MMMAQQNRVRPPTASASPSRIKYTPSETTQIYTDWANHYLEKVKSKRRIHDLPNDVTDGVVLADVIEAVTNQKLLDVNRKPKTTSHMIDNITACLRLLRALGIPLEDVSASDIHQGNLKSILTVFFALSRYKQQQKLHAQQQQLHQEMAKIPLAKGNTTSIPIGSAGKKPQMISKIAMPSSIHYGSPQLRPLSSAATSAASSRSTSPSRCSTGSGNLCTGSLIPRTPVKIPTAPNSSRLNSIKTPVTTSSSLSNKPSMLDKFKLGKSNEAKSSNVPTPVLSKRPSSSSGFSSGRSEQSDNSSFSNGNSSMVTAPLTTLAVFDQPPVKKSSLPNGGNGLMIQNGTKERSIRTTRSNKNSPKLSPKVKRVGETDESATPSNNKMIESISHSVKPLGIGSGIPKPMAAVKGTAKIICKPTSVEESALLQRTPGDGKEVSNASVQVTCKLAVNESSVSSKVTDNCGAVPPFENHTSTPAVDTNCDLGNPIISDFPNVPSSELNTSQMQPSLAEESTVIREDSPNMKSDGTNDQQPQLSDLGVTGKGQVAKVLPMTPSIIQTTSGDHPEEDEDVSMNVQPMTPLFNIIKRHEQSPACSSAVITTVKRAANEAYADDPLDGYLSESGASLYARKMHYFGGAQRLKDDDSFDDSSSLSSGVSDPWNEIYGHHLKMENGNAYPGIPSGYGTPLQNRRHIPTASESSPYKQISSSQWKKFIETGPLPSSERFQAELWKGEGRERSRSQQQEPSSPKRTEHKKLNSIEAGKRVKVYAESEALSGGRPVKGVPASFGYVKKSSDMKRSIRESSIGNGKGLAFKTANVTSVPRLKDEQPISLDQSLERPKTRLKVSGGTQTDLGGASRIIRPSQHKVPTLSSSATQPNGSYSDSEYQTPNRMKFTLSGNTASPTIATTDTLGKSNYQQPTFKSYSLTAPVANQLSLNVRERLMLNSGTQSLPKTNFNHIKDDKRQAQTNFAAHLFAGVGELNGEANMNLDTTGAGYNSANKLCEKDKSIKYVVNGRNVHTDGTLSDTPYTAYWNKYHPRNTNDLVSDPESLDSVPMHGPKMPWMNSPSSPRLNRSNSARSTKSEKVYPSMMQRNEEGELNHFGAPLENAGDNNHRYGASSTGNHYVSRSSLGNYSALLSLSRIGSKEEDCHGSSLSLVSTASSLYSSQEEKQASEIRKLRRELGEAHEKVNTLSGQLSTNAHVVAAFEQSLASMTSRLQSLTMAAEQKEAELQELRNFVDQLRKQGSVLEPSSGSKSETQLNRPSITRQLSSDSVCSNASEITNSSSLSSAISPPQPQPPSSPSNSLKKKSWLRNSFSKAFSRSKRPPGSIRQSTGSDSEDSSGPSGGSTWSAPSSPMLTSHVPHHHHLNAIIKSEDTMADRSQLTTPETLQDLKKQLREKDMVLTDIRLEALSSAHQLEALKETVSKMRNEMLNLKQDNERLQRQVEHQSASSSPHNTVDRRDGQHRSPTQESSVITDFMLGIDDKDCKSIGVVLQFDDSIEDSLGSSNWMMGYVAVSGKTRWDLLDRSIKKLFTDYVKQIDPSSHLGLDDECLWYYRVGEIVRPLTAEDLDTCPELLPCGYLVGDCNQIYVFVKTIAQFALPAYLSLETLIPLPIINRYVSLLSEHRRVIICGPSGTGKSYLARKLAEYCVAKNGKSPTSQFITTLKVDASSCKEVRLFFNHIKDSLIAGQLNDIPDVIILEDLHLSTSFQEMFSPLAGFETSKIGVQYPYVVATTSPMTQSSSHLQLQFNFRWILLTNHMEPVQGLIQRFLRRRLIQSELKNKACDRELEQIIDWIPRCWAHINKFLETHNSTVVTIGPRWFLNMPVDSTCSQVWFTDLWNYTLGPYLLHAAKEGLELYGKRTCWEDPVQWVMSTYPWPHGSAYDTLMRLRPEDVGYNVVAKPKPFNSVEQQDQDPLFNMLSKLQEVANLPSPSENSDNSSESVSSGIKSTIDD